MPDIQKVLLSELETLTGKIIVGDLTPVVFSLFKDTADVEGLRKAIQEVTNKSVHFNKTNRIEMPQSNNRYGFEEWILQCEKL